LDNTRRIIKFNLASVDLVKKQFLGLGEDKCSGDGVSEGKPVRCQKCGKPIGYVTVLARGLLGMQQPLQNVKVVAVCMDCAQKQT
jgi:hypothetical protein